MIILDTQHISQLQLIGTDSDIKAEIPPRTIAGAKKSGSPIISPYEQLREYLARDQCDEHSARRADPRVQRRSVELLDYLCRLEWTHPALSTEAAAEILSEFTPQLIRRIGPRDSRIAAIALANDATLLSANLRDFQQVPGLRVEDWLRE